jgi:hypothetical protein
LRRKERKAYLEGRKGVAHAKAQGKVLANCKKGRHECGSSPARRRFWSSWKAVERLKEYAAGQESRINSTKKDRKEINGKEVSFQGSRY